MSRDVKRDSAVRELFGGGGWFRIPMRMLHIGLNFTEVMLLAYLLNHQAKINPDMLEKNEEWFFCPMKRICADIGISARVQNYRTT